MDDNVVPFAKVTIPRSITTHTIYYQRKDTGKTTKSVVVGVAMSTPELFIVYDVEFQTPKFTIPVDCLIAVQSESVAVVEEKGEDVSVH